MRAPQWVSDFFDWRWAPCVGLTAGSLAFVALALLLIPTHFGGEPRVVSSLSAYESQQPQRAIFSSALARPETDTDERKAEIARNARVARAVPTSLPRTTEAGAPTQRGFSPVLDRPEPVPQPAPAVPPPAPAAPSSATAEPSAPTPGTVLIQPGPGPEAREVPQ
jgi:hypothetical protein